MMLAIVSKKRFTKKYGLPASVGTALTAANDSELTTALSTSASGQHIQLTGASYSTSRTLSAGKVLVGDPANPPSFTGNLDLSGDGAIVYGLDINGGTIVSSGNNVKILRNLIHGYTGTGTLFRITDGDDVLISHNEIYSWGAAGSCGAVRGLAIRTPFLNLTDGAIRPEVCYNYFHDQIGYSEEACPNDAEFIALGEAGSSERAVSQAYCHVHHNYASACNGDDEGMSVKSSYGTIEYNHFNNVRGFNNRLGGLNTYRGNRVTNQGGTLTNRGGYQNTSIGENFSGAVYVDGGNWAWGDTPSSYLQSDGTQIIGMTTTDLRIGDDRWSVWNLNATGTTVTECSVNPTLGAEQDNTTNNWNGSYGGTMPDTITLTTAQVGPSAGY